MEAGTCAARPSPTPTLTQKAAAAAGAACVSAVVVNPLDIVKTRQQAGAAAAAAAALGSRLAAGGAERPLALATAPCIPSCPRVIDPRAHHAAECYIHDGSVETARRIVRHEGWRALWRGTGPTLAMAVPSVAVYLPVYDWLQAQIADAGAPGAAPALAGAAARALAVFGVAPLELVRTRAQAAPGGAGGPPPRGVAAGLAAVLASEPGPGSAALRLWRGCSATLARDVPFSAIYWTILEPLRAELLADASRRRAARDAADGADAAALDAACAAAGPCGRNAGDVLRASVVAGGVAGALAAAVTTPLDVAKTLLQLPPAPGAPRKRDTLAATLRRVAATQGVGGLFVGALPRALRAAPACAIVLASYEVLQQRMCAAAAQTS